MVSELLLEWKYEFSIGLEILFEVFYQPKSRVKSQYAIIFSKTKFLTSFTKG